RAASTVSSDVSPQASNPRNTHPPTASAASSAAAVDPPESPSAPSVSWRIDASWWRKASRSTRPTPTDAITSAPIPTLTARLRRSRPRRFTTAQVRTSTVPVTTIAFAVGFSPTATRAHGAPRYAIVVFATAYAHRQTQPLNHPYRGPIRRRLHWYAAFAIGNSDASSEYTASSRHCPTSATGSIQTHAPPATVMPTTTTPYRATTGEIAAKPIATLSNALRRRRSS